MFFNQDKVSEDSNLISKLFYKEFDLINVPFQNC